jgi:CTP synthase (UTP-ammonia lyase)
MKPIALIGEFSPTFPPHLATQAALAHASTALGVAVEGRWLSTEALDEEMVEHHSALWIAPGSPYKNLGRTLRAIRHARETEVPCLGTCGGFQHMILEYARNVLGVQDAHHAEYDPYASDLFISHLACSLAGRELPLTFVPGSRIAAIYGAEAATEQYYCNFGVNPRFVPLFRSGPLRVSGSDAEGEIRVIELPEHPFFLGTLFVPQMRSLPGQPHPLVMAFLRAALDRP